MKRVERAARAELRTLPEALRVSTLAAAVVALAARLDGDPSDREASALARELRMSLSELHRLAGGGESEQEAIVAKLRNPALDH